MGIKMPELLVMWCWVGAGVTGEFCDQWAARMPRAVDPIAKCAQESFDPGDPHERLPPIQRRRVAQTAVGYDSCWSARKSI